MRGTFQALASRLTDNPVAVTVKDSAHQVWLAGLGAYSIAQDEGGRVFDALVKEGEIVDQKRIEYTDAKISDLSDKAVGAWERIEKEFEHRMTQALGNLGVPCKKDIDEITERVAALTDAVEALSRRQRSRVKAAAPTL